MLITIKFATELNVSVQPMDTLYMTTLDQKTSGSNNSFGKSKPIAVGVIHKVDHASSEIEVENSGFANPGILTAGHFFFFSKNRIANTSGLIGYYAEVEYRNDSKKAAEIFAVGAEYAPSSK